MKIITPEISWHERDPIYTCAFHPIRKNLLATAGVTGIVRVSFFGFQFNFNNKSHSNLY